MSIGDGMEGTTPLWAFNVFVMVLFVWFYYYFYSMFNAIADLNDSLIGLMTKSNDLQEDEAQTTLTEFFPEEEEE